ncbi:hypothetical protein ZIOFF_006360 [Zingiber officinale]|uniref:Uncharacterized protein n=1 Tax=Zingiber officinale TaxID=94328 RepID=A0A8J5LS95_ZINOF|nr:hypothetical protein ZIOFF_006360 [Zingiber officinale]
MATMFPSAVERVVLCCAGVCLEERDLAEGLFVVSNADDAVEILLPQSPEKLRQLVRLYFVHPPRIMPSCFLRDYIQVMCTVYAKEKIELLHALIYERKHLVLLEIAQTWSSFLQTCSKRPSHSAPQTWSFCSADLVILLCRPGHSSLQTWSSFLQTYCSGLPLYRSVLLLWSAAVQTCPALSLCRSVLSLWSAALQACPGLLLGRSGLPLYRPTLPLCRPALSLSSAALRKPAPAGSLRLSAQVISTLSRLDENVDHMTINSTSSIMSIIYNFEDTTTGDDLQNFINDRNRTGMMIHLGWYFNDHSTCREAKNDSI